VEKKEKPLLPDVKMDNEQRMQNALLNQNDNAKI
jgi:hypothetical protein